MSGARRPGGIGLWGWLAVGVLAALFGMIAALYVGGAAYRPSTDGLPDPGGVVGWGLPLAKTCAVMAGTLTIGALVSAAFLQQASGQGVVSRTGRGDLRLAAGAAAVWSVSALLTVAFTHAVVLGKPLIEALDPDLFLLYAFEIPQNVAYLASAIIAALVAIGAALSVRTGSAALLAGAAGVALVAPPLTAHGSSLGDHSLAMTAGASHALAAALWVGGLVVMALHAWRRDPGFPVAIRRFSTLATGCVIVLVISGLGNAYSRLEQPSDIVNTGYGALVLAKVVLLGVMLLVARNTRRQLADLPEAARGITHWLIAEALLLAVTVGVAIGLTLTAYPRSDVPMPSAGEELLGFRYPPVPTFASVMGDWNPDVFFLVTAVVLTGVYVLGVVRCRRRGVPWPWGRTIAWLAGVAVLVWATSFGIAGYAKVSVQWHMVQHMALAMIIPILLVLGMPATLALRAIRPSPGSDRGPREWVLWLLHSSSAKLQTHPLIVLALGTFGLFGLYLTPLFGWAMGSHLGHILMNLHFLLSGFLFYWVVLGLDPAPRRVPAWMRLVLMLVFISLHAFFAIAVMSMTRPLAPEWFALVQPPWLTDAVADTVAGGGVAWAFGEIPTLIVMIIVAVQWARSEERDARRYDRQADRDDDAELRAYNERLRQLAERTTSGQ